MSLYVIFVVLSGILTFGCFVPYFIDMINGTTKPRIVSWLIWTILAGIACVMALTEHQYSTAILLFISSLGTLFIVVFGWKKGDKEIGYLDKVCLAGAMVGLVLWIIFNSPAAAVLATILIDFLGGVPTLAHSWKKPSEETWATFALSFLGAFFTLLTIDNWRITAYAFPLYLVIINLIFTLIIVVKRRSTQIKKR